MFEMDATSLDNCEEFTQGNIPHWWIIKTQAVSPPVVCQGATRRRRRNEATLQWRLAAS